jgi:hypothetical protein
MPMKTVNDIPDDARFVVRWHTVPKKSIEVGFVDADGNHRLDLGVLVITPILGGTKLVVARNIQAGHGWGPFLVDVAMEYVTALGGQLYPHPVGVVPDAKLMWKVYHDDRTDVTHTVFSDDEINQLGVQHTEAELRCAYQKAGSPIIDELKRKGKWSDEIRGR